MSQNSSKQVVDFNQARQQKLEEKRKNTERLFFKNVLGIYSVSEDQENATVKLRSIDFVDVSEEGLSFIKRFDENDPWPNQQSELMIRIYFSQESFLPLRIRIRNSNPYIEDGVKFVRYGCEVDTKMTSYEAFIHFVRFLRAYSVHSHKDSGGVSFFYV